MTRCRRCHRPLKREPYRSQGIGKICAAKEGFESMKQKDGDNDEIVPYHGGDFFIEKSLIGIRTNVSRTEYLHSPTGFGFGYGGSGTADFALNLLLMVTDKENAHRLHQVFKWEFCAKGTDRLEIKREDVISFINKNTKIKEHE